MGTIRPTDLLSSFPLTQGLFWGPPFFVTVTNPSDTTVSTREGQRSRGSAVGNEPERDAHKGVRTFCRDLRPPLRWKTAFLRSLLETRGAPAVTSHLGGPRRARTSQTPGQKRPHWLPAGQAVSRQCRAGKRGSCLRFRRLRGDDAGGSDPGVCCVLPRVYVCSKR